MSSRPLAPNAHAARPVKICVASGKGGVGKSTISANLAVRLGAMGHSVILVDGDLGLANLDIMLGVIPERTVEHFFSEGTSLEELLVPGSAGVRVLPAGSGLRELTRLGLPAARRFSLALERLASTVDFMIIDSAAGIGDQVLDLALFADEVVLVAWPDPAALVDVYALLKVLRAKAPRQPVSLVANGVASEADAQRLHARLDAAAERFLGKGVPMRAWVPRDAAFAELAASQTVLCVGRPLSDAAQSIGVLAESFVGNKEDALAPEMIESALRAARSGNVLH
jgi:flagellar biosynthesis protein FlhG